MSVLIRPARESDKDVVSNILIDFLTNTPWMPKRYKVKETRGFCGAMITRGWVSVAEIAGEAQAFLARNGQFVHALYVARGMCNRHIGHRLLRDAQMQETALDLWTFQANTGAQRFYLREGFQEIERTEGQGNDENLPDIHYRWERGQYGG